MKSSLLKDRSTGSSLGTQRNRVDENPVRPIYAAEAVILPKRVGKRDIAKRPAEPVSPGLQARLDYARQCGDVLKEDSPEWLEIEAYLRRVGRRREPDQTEKP